MNTQTNPKPSVPSDLASESEARAQLKIVERTGQMLQRQCLGWMVVAAICVPAMHAAPAAWASLVELGLGGALGMAALWLGRWMQSRRMEHWLRARLVQAPQDWSTLPAPSLSFPARAYASVDEAQSRGWAFGPVSGAFGGGAIPAWANFNGQRFVFDGLAPAQGLPSIPEDTRLFGRLRYRLLQDAPSPPSAA